jgi:hypothetical protein
VIATKSKKSKSAPRAMTAAATAGPLTAAEFKAAAAIIGVGDPAKLNRDFVWVFQNVGRLAVEEIFAGDAAMRLIA